MLRIILLILFAPIGFNVPSSTIPNEKNTTAFPPGCVKIIDSLYADKAEIANIDYRQYQYWIKRIFGKESAEYQETLLDTTVWNKVDGLSKLTRKYHADEKYSNYPVVGITLAQARLYTSWRTDRVMEKVLIDLGIMSFDPEQNSGKLFHFRKVFEWKLHLC